MQHAQQTKKESLKVPRKPLPENIIESGLVRQQQELGSLVNALPPHAAAIGQHIWREVLSYLDSRSFRSATSACWYFRVVGDTDMIWESLFAREIGGVSIVPMQCASWRQRFFLHQSVSDFTAALATVEDGDEIILCPGVHEDDGASSSFFYMGQSVEKKVHILGCCFNRKYAADMKWNHPEEVTISNTPGNVVIHSSSSNALTWNAAGGSIRNLDIEYVNPDPARYFFGLKVGTKEESTAKLELFNVGVRSAQQMAVSVQSESYLRATNCRFFQSTGSCLSLLENSVAELCGCILDTCSNGVSNNGGAVTLERCVIFGNHFHGVGGANPNTKTTLIKCNIFANGLNGIDMLADIQDLSVKDCDVHDNLNGLSLWMPKDSNAEKGEQLRSQMASANQFHDNRREDLKIRVMPHDGRNLAEIALEEDICSFLLTGPQFVEQKVFHCRTCKLDTRDGCCEICARHCHKDHEVALAYTTSFYCDCCQKDECHFRDQVKVTIEEKRQWGTQSGGK